MASIRILTVFLLLAFSATATASWDNKTRAFSLVPSSEDSLCTEEFFQSIRNLRAMGANRFSFIVPYSQQTLDASQIYPYSRTPTDEALACGINYVLSQGLDFGINLVINVPGWRANIDPVDRNYWFTQMGEIATKYARDFAQPYGAQHMSVATEMYKLVSNSHNPENAKTIDNYRWPDIIADMRAEFSGQIMYSAQHSGDRSAIFEPNDLIEHIDVLGFSGYWPLNVSANKDSIVAEWARIERDNILPAIDLYGKQIVLSEVGYRPCNFALLRPYDSEEPCTYDPDTQALAWDSLMTFFSTKDYLDGLIGGWAWEDDPRIGGEGDTSYTPWGKPAALTIASHWATATLTAETNVPGLDHGTSDSPVVDGEITPVDGGLGDGEGTGEATDPAVVDGGGSTGDETDGGDVVDAVTGGGSVITDGGSSDADGSDGEEASGGNSGDEEETSGGETTPTESDVGDAAAPLNDDTEVTGSRIGSGSAGFAMLLLMFATMLIRQPKFRSTLKNFV